MCEQSTHYTTHRGRTSGALSALRRGPPVPRVSYPTPTLRVLRSLFFFCCLGRWAGVFRHVPFRVHRRRLGLGGGNRLCSAILGACPAVGAADLDHDATAIASSQGPSDRATISPQGRGGLLHGWRGPVNVALTRRLRSGLAVPAVFALVATIIFVGLGTWQLQRKTWKEALIETLEQRLSAPPGDLPPRERWASLSAANDEFRRMKVSAAFVPGAEALVYTSGSALRSDVSGPGYWVFAPVQLGSGGLVVINRGFVPEGRQDLATRAAGAATARADLVGVLRWPESRGAFSPKDDPDRNIWFVGDPVAIAAAKSWGEVAPFFIELESPQPSGGLPRPGALKVNLRN